MPLPKPNQIASSGGKKRLAISMDQGWLELAANKAVYGVSNPYHCYPYTPRMKPATHCPRRWSEEEATRALRSAILRAFVPPAEKWEDGFPRYVWYMEGEIIYEARHTRGPHGTYHAYPIEKSKAPSGLTP